MFRPASLRRSTWCCSVSSSWRSVAERRSSSVAFSASRRRCSANSWSTPSRSWAISARRPSTAAVASTCLRAFLFQGALLGRQLFTAAAELLLKAGHGLLLLEELRLTVAECLAVGRQTLLQFQKLVGACADQGKLFGLTARDFVLLLRRSLSRASSAVSRSCSSRMRATASSSVTLRSSSAGSSR